MKKIFLLTLMTGLIGCENKSANHDKSTPNNPNASSAPSPSPRVKNEAPQVNAGIITYDGRVIWGEPARQTQIKLNNKKYILYYAKTSYVEIGFGGNTIHDVIYRLKDETAIYESEADTIVVVVLRNGNIVSATAKYVNTFYGSTNINKNSFLQRIFLENDYEEGIKILSKIIQQIETSQINQ